MSERCCVVCGVFFFNRHSWSKACSESCRHEMARARDRMRYLASREERIAYEKDKYWRNPEVRRSKERQRRVANPAKMRTRDREQYLRHRDDKLRSAKEFYRKNKTKINDRKRLDAMIFKALKGVGLIPRDLLARHSTTAARRVALDMGII